MNGETSDFSDAYREATDWAKYNGDAAYLSIFGSKIASDACPTCGSSNPPVHGHTWQSIGNKRIRELSCPDCGTPVGQEEATVFPPGHYDKLDLGGPWEANRDSLTATVLASCPFCGGDGCVDCGDKPKCNKCGSHWANEDDFVNDLTDVIAGAGQLHRGQYNDIPAGASDDYYDGGAATTGDVNEDAALEKASSEVSELCEDNFQDCPNAVYADEGEGSVHTLVDTFNGCGIGITDAHFSRGSGDVTECPYVQDRVHQLLEGGGE